MNYLNNLIKVCLNIADYYDNKGDNDNDFLEDDMIKEIGIGYRTLTSHLRKGVQEIISLQSDYHNTRRQMNSKKLIQDDNMISMLKGLQSDIDEIANYRTKDDLTLVVDMSKIDEIIQQKINMVVKDGNVD